MAVILLIADVVPGQGVAILTWANQCNPSIAGYYVLYEPVTNPITPITNLVVASMCNASNPYLVTNLDVQTYSAPTPYTQVDVGDTNAYTITNLSYGQTYQFTVASYSTGYTNLSYFAARVYYTTPPLPPTILNVKPY